MDAAADYDAVRRALDAALPAYVSYVVESFAGFDAVHASDTTTIVVRTSDGKIVSGKSPQLQIDSREYDGEVLRHGPFKPTCYEASNATLTTFESQPVEALALHALCHEKVAADHTDDTEFRTMYVDPASHRPIAVVGDSDQKYVTAHLAEHFSLANGYVVPSSFTVKVAGSGPMFWLNVDARQTYRDFQFKSGL